MRNEFKIITIVLLSLFCTLFSRAQNVNSPNKGDIIKVMADLPDKEKYKIENSNEYYDLGRIHREVSIFGILPIWVSQEPRLVLINPEKNAYKELGETEIQEILKENDLSEKKMYDLGFTRRIGGKGILLLILALIILEIIEKRKFKKVPPHKAFPHKSFSEI